MGERDPAGNKLAGTILEGAYKVTRLIGEGGMGAVYEAVQLRIGKRVAIKVMARDLAANQEALARFRREAEVTSQLGHPHIVQVFDFGAAPTGEPYLVMEYMEGQDLDQRLRAAGRLPLASVVRVVKQVASALAATHARGIVHRDLKPANIFLLQAEGVDEFVKVVDFGISKARAAAIRLTRSRSVIGTPHYMAPEQAQGRVEEIDARTDQWALAVIAWELIAGRVPFVGEDVNALLYQVSSQEPPLLATRVPGVPVEIEQVLRRALSKARLDRYPSIKEFAQAFEAAAAAPPAIVDESFAADDPGSSPRKVTASYGPSPLLQQRPTTPVGSSAVRPVPWLPPPRTPEPPSRRQASTFSRTAGELAGEASARTLRAKPAWLLGVATAVVVAAAALLTTRSSPLLVETPSSADSKVASLAVHAQGWSLEESFQIGLSGAHPFADAPTVYVASIDPGAAILLGQEWIRVRDESKMYAGGPQATLRLRAPADVFLVVDDRWGSPPPFTAGWTDTGANLQVWDGRERSTFQFSVYQKSGATRGVVLPAIGGSGAYDYFVVLR